MKDNKEKTIFRIKNKFSHLQTVPLLTPLSRKKYEEDEDLSVKQVVQSGPLGRGHGL